MEDIDIRIVIRKLLRKWYWFVLSVAVCLGAATFYLAATQVEYEVESTIQIKDKSTGGSSMAQERFLSGVELLHSDSELEDEIGILTSYSTISQTLINLDLEVTYFEFPELPGAMGKIFAQELYPPPFVIHMDTAGWQLMHTPVYVSFLENNQYRVTVSASDTPLNLYNVYNRKISYGLSAVELDTVLSINQVLKTSFLNLSVEVIDPAVFGGDISYYFTIGSHEEALEFYKKNLTTAQISPNSNILKLSITASAPVKQAVFLERLCNIYINNDLQKKNRLGERTIEFIDFQLQGVTDSLQMAENTLETFRAKSQIIDVGVTSQNLNGQLYSLEEKQSQLMLQHKYYTYIADYLALNDDVTDIVAPSSVGIQDQLLSSLILQLSSLNQDKITKDYNSSKYNPVLQLLEKKIASTKTALVENVKNLIGTNEIAQKENAGRIRQLEQTINRLPENEKDLTDIQRRFTFNDNIYNYLLQKRAEAGISIASNLPDKRIIDVPRQLGAASPNRLFVILAALLVGLITPAGFIFTKDYFQPKLEDNEQLQYWTNIPVIEQISLVKGNEKTDNYLGQSYLAHAFRYIRQHIGILQLTRQVKVVGITSATSGEGKTFCALHLGIVFANAGRKTLLIEADLHQPKLSRHFKVKAQPGLSNYLMGKETEVVQKTEVENLDIISAGEPTYNPSDLLSHAAIDNLLSSLRDSYEFIIVDTPPVGIIADYLLLSKHIDYTMLVVRQNYSEKDDIKRLDKLAKDHQLHAGIIYNGAKVTRSYGGYYRTTNNINVQS